MDKRYQIFVSSTFADLKDERQQVIQALMEMDCIPSGMELFPAQDDEQWDFIRRVINDCDYYLLIIGGRYGSLSEDGVSYTEKEFDYAVSNGLKVIALLHENPGEISVAKSEVNPELREKLEAFRQKVSSNRLVKFWSDAKELPGLVALSLSKTIKAYPAVGWVRADRISNEDVLSELNQVRKENEILKARLAELDTHVELVDSASVANIDDKITINGTTRMPRRGNSAPYITSWSATVSWKQIFAFIAPYLEEKPNESRVKASLANSLANSVDVGGSSRTMDDQEFKTVSIQLRAYNLVKIERLRTTDGGTALFWSLTPEGEKTMFELRAVRK